VPIDGDTLPPNVVNVVNDVELTDDPGDPDGNTVDNQTNNVRAHLDFIRLFYIRRDQR
jgi:hypothetical protein